VGWDSAIGIMILQAGLSRNQIPVGVRFLHLSKPTLGPTQPPIQWVPCLSQG